MSGDQRINLDPTDINGLWELVQGNVQPNQFKTQYPDLFQKIENYHTQVVGSSGGSGRT